MSAEISWIDLERDYSTVHSYNMMIGYLTKQQLK